MNKLAILGAGESGLGAAILALQKGMDVFVSDNGKIKEKYRDELQQLGVDWEENGHDTARILNCDEVVKSPGIPDDAELIMSIRERGIPVISEIELAARYTKARKICITGSNGKTTTTLLTYHILKNAGFNVGLAGNVGPSFARDVAENERDYYVLELSSFQLDGMYNFHAEIAVLLNITPDHLNRYQYNFGNYAASKFRIVRNQTADDTFIYCDDDEGVRQFFNQYSTTASKYPFSIEHPVDQGAFVQDNTLFILTNAKPFEMSIHDLALQGKHNLYDSMAAGIAARVLEIRKELVRDSLSDFQNVEHRLEFVAEIHGIKFVNDSKATNVNSTWYALESQDHPVIWIVGGVDKGNDYSMLLPLVKEKVKAIVCLGDDNSKIIEFFKDHVDNIVEAKTAAEAVNYGYQVGKTGDVVLLSPACASFDLFENYEDRGQKFKSAVKAL